jgi:rubrerythrin
MNSAPFNSATLVRKWNARRSVTATSPVQQIAEEAVEQVTVKVDIPAHWVEAETLMSRARCKKPGCVRFPFTGFNEGYCCIEHWSGKDSHNPQCDDRAAHDGNLCEDFRCEKFLRPHSHWDWVIPRVRSSAIAGRQTFNETITKPQEAVRKKLRKKSLLVHKKRSPEAEINWRKYLRRDRQTQMEARARIPTFQFKQHDMVAAHTAISIPKEGPLFDFTCPECGYVWVGAAESRLIYCPKCRMHMNYRSKQIPHSHRGWSIDVTGGMVCKGCQREVINQLVDFQPSQKYVGMGYDPARQGGLHMMTLFKNAVAYNDQIERGQISAESLSGYAIKDYDLATSLGPNETIRFVGRMTEETAERVNREVKVFLAEIGATDDPKRSDSIQQHQDAANNRVNARRWLEKFVEGAITKYKHSWYVPHGVIQDLEAILSKVRSLDYTGYPEFK